MLKRMEYAATNGEHWARRLALWSIFLGAALAIAKILVGLAAHSTAVLSDGLEATADIVSSGIVLAGLWIASRPPDEDHPYGHGRYELLAGLGVGALLLLTGSTIFWRSFASLDSHTPVKFFAIYPLLAGVVLKTIMAIMKFITSRRISSASLRADAWHDTTDLFSTMVALLAVSLSLWGPDRFGAADHIGGMVIAFIVIFVGIRVIRSTVEQLVDTMPNEKLMWQIRSVALEVPGAAGIEKCFARRTGLTYHVDLHLEVDPEMTVRESHDVARAVRTKIKEQLKWVADVLVHVEPSPSPSAVHNTSSAVRGPGNRSINGK